MSDHSRKLTSRIWASPTVTTLASVGSTTAQGLLVLPIVLHSFDPESVAVWSVFITLQGMQGIIAAGLSPTFARALAYAVGGARDVREMSGQQIPEGDGAPNWGLVTAIGAAMRTAYRRLSLGSLLVFATFLSASTGGIQRF
jgi:hypothetical protein